MPDLTHSDVATTAPPISPMRRLDDAHNLIMRDLSMSAMTRRIAEAACRVTGSAYAGLLLLGADGEVVDWAQHGLSEREIEALRHLVGPVSHDRGSAKARAEQLAAAGLVHRSVQLRGERIAELYLPRTVVACEADDELLTALLSVIAHALESARLHSEAERSRDWLHASNEIARTLLADQGADTLMDVVYRALHVADADYAALCIPRTDGLLDVTVSAGIGADEYRGYVLDPAKSRLAEAICGGETLLTDMRDIMREGFENFHDFGATMLTPLADAHGVRGSVVLCRQIGRAPFTGRDLDLATIFADQVVLALGMDDARAQGAWLSVLEDRHRIAQDLHDNVMQRLFAMGVGLQSLAVGDMPSDIARRLGRYIDDLDETIDEIRSRVFGLRDDQGQVVRRAPTRFPYVAQPGGV